MRHFTFVTLAAGATSAFASPISSSSATYACNPAHQYPEGVQCLSTNGALSFVTPSVTATASSTGYACNPAHSYPNGASCISTNGALSLVTPTAAASSTVYACNPAHEACATVSGQLVPAKTAADSAAASSAAKAASTGSASSGESKAQDLTWTVENLSRYCAEDKSGCDYNFNLTASDNRPSQACTIIRLDVKDAPTESWSDIACTANSAVKVSWGYSAQFGAENAFAVMTVVNDEEKAKAYFGVANVNSQRVIPSNPYGSGLYGNIGPQPVYLF